MEIVPRARKPSLRRDCDADAIRRLVARTEADCRPGRPHRKWFSHQLDVAVAEAKRGYCRKATKVIKRARRVATCRRPMQLGQTNGDWCVFYVPLYGGIQRVTKTYKTRASARKAALEAPYRFDKPFGKFVARKCDNPPKRR